VRGERFAHNRLVFASDETLRECAAVSTFDLPLVFIGIGGRIFSGGGNSGFFQMVTERIVAGRQRW